MLKLIAGRKGSGKTKKLISMVNEAVEKSEGKIVCIEKGKKLTYDVNHGARLIDTDEYGISGYDAFYGFIAGVAACDYDVKEIYIDSFFKICGSEMSRLPEFVGKAEKLSQVANVSFVITISADAEAIPEEARKYII